MEQSRTPQNTAGVCPTHCFESQEHRNTTEHIEKRISVNCEALLRARALRYCGVDDDPMRRVLLAPQTNTGA